MAIVATGGDVTAFLKRDASDDSSTNGDIAAAAEIAAVSEPSGWGAEPTPEPEPEPALQDVAPEAIAGRFHVEHFRRMNPEPALGRLGLATQDLGEVLAVPVPREKRAGLDRPASRAGPL